MTNATDNLMNSGGQYHTSSLNVLRFLAAMSVLLNHVIGLADFGEQNSVMVMNMKGYNNLFSGINSIATFMGVVSFFFISGFLIVRMQQRYSPKEMIINRLFRIYPMAIVAVIMMTLTDLKDHTIWEILINMSLLYDVFNVPIINGVFWTLIIEITFYAISIYVRKWDFDKIKKTIYIITLINLVAWALYRPLGHWHGSQVICRTVGYLPLLFVGTAVALNTPKKFIWQLYFWSVVNGWLVAGVWPYSGRAKDLTMLFLLYVFVFYGFLKSDYLNQLGKSKLWRNLANISYGIYVFHLAIGNWLILFFTNTLGQTNVLLFLPIFAVVTCIVSYIASATVEQYGIQYGRKIITKMRGEN